MTTVGQCELWLTPLKDITPFTSLADIVTALETVRAHIPIDTDEFTRETMRAMARQMLRGTRATAGMIDAAFSKPQKASQEEHAEPGPALVPVALFRPDDEPWPEPVDGADVLDEVAALIRRHVVLPETFADAIALWVMHAYSLASASIMPILTFVAPTMRAGKSTLATIVGAVAPRAWTVSSATPAVVFRVADKDAPTLIGDEADNWRLDKSELKGIFNSGHTRSTASVARCEGGKVRVFSTWCPKVLAMIGRPPSTIADRSIVIPLKRRRQDEHVARLRHDHLAMAAEPIRRRLRRWAQDRLDALREADPELPATLNDREADNWRGPLAIADMAGGPWPARGCAAALATSAADAEEPENLTVELLADIQIICADRTASLIPSADLVTALVAMSDRPWAERRLTPAKLAQMLKPFGVRPFDAKVRGTTLKCYRRDALADAWERYVRQK